MAIRIHGGARDTGILDFSANINPLGIPGGIKETLISSIEILVRYPDPECRELTEAICRRNRCNPGRVVCGNGAVELIFAAMHALRPTIAVITVPSFCEYQLAAGSAGVPVRTVSPKGDDLRLNVRGLAEALEPRSIGILCSPNNPTGESVGQEDLDFLIRKADAIGAYLMVDEAFIDFVPGWETLTAARYLDGNDRLIILRSMTKFHAIPGLRLGYALASPVISEGLKAAKDPWSVNAMAQAAGVAALADTDYEAKTLSIVHRERERLYKGILGIPGLTPVPGASANFVMIRVDGTGSDSPTFTERMGGNGVAVRDCGSFDGLNGEYIRVAVRDELENGILMEALARTACHSEGGIMHAGRR